MGLTRLNLVAIRSANIDRAAEFYENLGLEFEKHRHGNGPEHYSCECHEVVFEIYPLPVDSKDTAEARLGFSVSNLGDTLAKLTQIFCDVIAPPKASPWGLRAVVSDFDGHRIELIEDKRLSGVQAASAVDG